MTPGLELFLQQLLNGLTIGMVYALIALGYTMVYGVLQLINFAHGEIFMVGGYLALTAAGLAASLFAGAPFFVVLLFIFLVSMAGAALLGAAIERSAYRPLRGSPKLTVLISSIGMSFVLQNAVMLIYGSREKSMPEVLPPWTFDLGGVTLTLVQIIIFVTGLSLMAFLNFFVKHTAVGKAMRATAENPEAASLVGISVTRVIRTTFVLGSALAAVGGSLFAMNYGSLNFHDGYLAGLKAFTAAVFGGIGSIPGAMLGGILLGVFEGFSAGYISSSWKDVFAFGLLVLLLLFRPSGILGENVREKV
jgi:branched-chain amino acid transport system permease protein